MPPPLPRKLLARVATTRGILLCLDYDGTLAELTADAANARPVDGVKKSIEEIARAAGHAKVAIVTGRTIEDIQRLLGTMRGISIFGLHGLTLRDAQGRRHVNAEAVRCASELAQVSDWFTVNVPNGRGFRIEDKRAVLGLHHRNADVAEAAKLCSRLSDFVSGMARLKVVNLTRLIEVMPRCASKASAIGKIMSESPRGMTAVYFGDEQADEEAFASLCRNDIGVLVGRERASYASYRVDSPRVVAAELQELASSLTRHSIRAEQPAAND